MASCFLTKVLYIIIHYNVCFFITDFSSIIYRSTPCGSNVIHLVIFSLSRKALTVDGYDIAQ